MSTNGGVRPLWARDSRELFYTSLDALMAVRGEPRPTWTATAPTTVLTNAAFNIPNNGGVTYDISPDGRRFLVLKPAADEEAVSAHLVVVQNWTDELKRLAPAN